MPGGAVNQSREINPRPRTGLILRHSADSKIPFCTPLYYSIIQIIIEGVFMSNPVNFRVRNKSVLAALDRIGTTLDRDRSYMLNEAMETYVELNRWQVEQIQTGLEEARQGKFVEQVSVNSLLKKKN